MLSDTEQPMPFILDKAIIAGNSHIGRFAYSHFKHGFMARINAHEDPDCGLCYTVQVANNYLPELTWGSLVAAETYVRAAAIEIIQSKEEALNTSAAI